MLSRQSCDKIIVVKHTLLYITPISMSAPHWYLQTPGEWVCKLNRWCRSVFYTLLQLEGKSSRRIKQIQNISQKPCSIYKLMNPEITDDIFLALSLLLVLIYSVLCFCIPIFPQSEAKCLLESLLFHLKCCQSVFIQTLFLVL